MTDKKTYKPLHPAAEKLEYIITTPSGFDPAKESLPLILFLHGAGERGDNSEIIRVHGIPKLFGADPDYHGLRVVTLSPQCPNGVNWNTVSTAVYELLQSIIEEYNIDRKRISVTGLSMGGSGSWDFGIRHHDMLAACAPICGGGVSWEASELRDVPVRCYHGLADTVVPPINTQEMARRLREAGGQVEEFYYEGVGHDSWVIAYEQTDLIEWLASAVRK